ncbi:arad-like aldolase/epimerase [Myriangium duriaei CBS 260.36]|uniref:Arad-like aldolase/epimerase n=1 Tax=Myriangium duriaei CBS 260.36 TaxID=1168546 RepID=A0A9P4MHL9_9PEZI|nr:arad-like aldolase/epimerase [Myriangium duriaei CBS 260.36]
MAPSAIPIPDTDVVPERKELFHEEEEEQNCQLHELSHGPNPLTGIPRFASHTEHRKHILIHMAAVFRSWARHGFIEGISGHISVRDPEYPELIWMNPIGKHFALLNASDMLCLHIDTGKIVGGNQHRPVNSPGFWIHSEIHKARPDVHSICHAHTIAGRAWASFGKPLEMITQDICDLYGSIATMNEYGGIVTAEQEGQQIARHLGTKNKAAILMNHGLITIGSTVDEASFLFGLLDRSCDIQLRVEAACAGNSSLQKKIIPDEMAKFNFAMAGEKNWLYAEAQPDIQLEIVKGGAELTEGVDNVTLDPRRWE